MFPVNATRLILAFTRPFRVQPVAPQELPSFYHFATSLGVISLPANWKRKTAAAILAV